MPVGPALPPHLQKRKRSIDDEDDDVGPAPPSKIRAATPPEAPKERRILGPAPPPADLAERPTYPASDNEDLESDSDDDYGPSLPPAPGSAAYSEAQAESAEMKRAEASASTEPAKLQRADWMLAPPSDSDWTSKIDPTKLKNRKFASGKGSKAPAEKSGVSAIWTETPEEKRQRLEDEVMGRKEAGLNSAPPKARKDDKEAEATARRIREYNDKNGSKTLMEMRKETEPVEKDDDPSQRAFDREKDMALGGNVGHMQKREMLKKAGDFGSRFERGNYL